MGFSTNDLCSPDGNSRSRLLVRGLYSIAESLRDRKCECASWIHERALILDLTARYNLRSAEVAAIDHKQNFLRDGRGRIIRIFFAGEQRKNRTALDVPVDADLTARIEAYLSVYRPNLAGSDCSRLFPRSHNSGARSC
jgi:hypothetical protein